VGPKTAMKLADKVIQSGGNLSTLRKENARYAQTNAFRDYLNLESYKGKDLLLKSLDFIYSYHLVPRYSRKSHSEPSNKKKIIFDLLYNYLLGFKTISEGIDSLYVNEDDPEADKGKIVISTIHQSKGLEWDSVHIVNMQEYGIPYLSPEDEKDAGRFEEEFCLAYVAATRARKKLNMYMQFMNSNNSYSSAKPNKMSRFIKEMYKNSKERFFNFIVLDVNDDKSYKENLYLKLNQKGS